LNYVLLLISVSLRVSLNDIDLASPYRLIVRQQPKHSRMCGYGEKVDRRPVDPPPIIQLQMDTGDTSSNRSIM
jgi:hypothetical protein